MMTSKRKNRFLSRLTISIFVISVSLNLSYSALSQNVQIPYSTLAQRVEAQTGRKRVRLSFSWRNEFFWMIIACAQGAYLGIIDSNERPTLSEASWYDLNEVFAGLCSDAANYGRNQATKLPSRVLSVLGAGSGCPGCLVTPEKITISAVILRD